MRQGSHVRVDLLLISLPKKAAQRLEQTTDVCGFFVSLVMAYYGSVVVLDAYRFKMQQFKSLVVPEWILLLPIVIGCTLLAIEFLLRTFRVEGVVDVGPRALVRVDEGVVAEKYNPADRPTI